MKLHEAQQKAEKLVEELMPYTVRCELAGSILRGKEEIGDIEIVAIPKWEQRKVASLLFADESFNMTTPVNLLYEYLLQSDIRWIYKRNGEVFDAAPKPDAKMMKGILPCGAQLDLFLACRENFGLIKMIRVGAADFSHEMVERARQINKPSRGGFLHTAGGNVIETPEELDVFRELGVAWIEPALRRGKEDMRIIGFGVKP